MNWGACLAFLVGRLLIGFSFRLALVFHGGLSVGGRGLSLFLEISTPLCYAAGAGVGVDLLQPRATQVK